MKSSVRRVFRGLAGPPVPLAARQHGGAHRFDLGVGKASRDRALRTYSMSGTVFSIVSLLAQSTASPQWCLFKKGRQDMRVRYTTGDQGSDQRIQVVQHAALSLWNRPNDFQTGFEFREGVQQHLELTGETYWVLNREVAVFPTAMWYVRPDRMEPVPDPQDYLVGWIYTGPSGERIPLKLDEVIQEKLPSPEDPYRGASPVSSILPNIDQQRYATEYQRNLFLNGATPGGIIQVAGRLSEPQFDELVDRWREAHQGVARAGRVGVLENGATWINDAPNNRDMEYGQLRLANRDELREAWRIHKHMLGTADDVNRANAQTAEETFTGWQTIPRLVRRRDTLNFKLLPLFGDTSVEFDFVDPTPPDRERDNLELQTKAQAAYNLITAGYDPHDVLEVVGLPDMETVEQATQLPALPPRWVPGQPAGPAPEPAPAGKPTQTPDKPAGNERIVIVGKSDQAKVFQQLADDYPPAAMGWVHHATWAGPVNVPLDHIDPTMPWMDQPDPSHVQEFVKRLEKGKKVNPVILVKTPNGSRLLLIDGHHRWLAAAELGRPVKAWIGTVDSDHGDWESMHQQQKPRGPGQGGGGDLAALLRQPFAADMIHVLNGPGEGK